MLTVCAALAAAVVCACTGSPAASHLRSSAHPAPTSGPANRDKPGLETLSLAGSATVRVPRRWFVTPFTGAPATVYFPLDFVSSDPLPTACESGARASQCQASNWFAPKWTTPGNGVLIMWAHAEFPTAGPTFTALPGHRVTIDHRPAKLYSGRATESCPTGTASEIDAYVRTVGDSGERFDMVACLGARAALRDRAAVTAMLVSLRIRPVG